MRVLRTAVDFRATLLQLWAATAAAHPLWARLFLSPLSRLFQGLVYLRQCGYRYRLRAVRSLPGQVISVGNLVVGGTGKSPTVSFLTAALVGTQRQVVILTRGYGSSLQQGEWCILLAGKVVQSSGLRKPFCADEPRMLSCHHPTVPILVGADRYAVATHYLQTHAAPQLWLLDDGFQHFQIHRDIDLVLLSGSLPLGNGWVLPRGSLREPASALDRAHALIRIGTSGQETVAWQGCPVFTLRQEITHFYRPARGSLWGPQVLQGRQIACVAAIARPERFVASLAAQGLQVVQHYFVPDHHPLCAGKLAALVAQGLLVVTTEKDYYRQPEDFCRLGEAQCAVARLETRGGEPLLQWLESRLHPQVQPGVRRAAE
ncbi:MAG: tetraacyldisaccharide 4'-kinase [Zetaproteobacteria bacterium]|nr:tetraacyldisaccharide 4'-kinase [Zetaproteobacteria bacterium]